MRPAALPAAARHLSPSPARACYRTVRETGAAGPLPNGVPAINRRYPEQHDLFENTETEECRPIIILSVDQFRDTIHVIVVKTGTPLSFADSPAGSHLNACSRATDMIA